MESLRTRYSNWTEPECSNCQPAITNRNHRSQSSNPATGIPSSYPPTDCHASRRITAQASMQFSQTKRRSENSGILHNPVFPPKYSAFP